MGIAWLDHARRCDLDEGAHSTLSSTTRALTMLEEQRRGLLFHRARAEREHDILRMRRREQSSVIGAAKLASLEPRWLFQPAGAQSGSAGAMGGAAARSESSAADCPLRGVAKGAGRVPGFGRESDPPRHI